jgi:hypothetical protein
MHEITHTIAIGTNNLQDATIKPSTIITMPPKLEAYNNPIGPNITLNNNPPARLLYVNIFTLLTDNVIIAVPIDKAKGFSCP